MPWTEASLIVPRLEAHDAPEVIKVLGTLLWQQGYVRETFVDAVLEREKTFPTGLPTEGIQVAIPHADVEHVLKPGIAIGVLEEPVEFGEMGSEDRKVRVKIVCVLAVRQSETLVLLLKNLVGMFQDVDFLRRIAAAGDAAQVASMFCDRLPMFQEA
jgi:PTS system galactitol-specific IIA component